VIGSGMRKHFESTAVAPKSIEGIPLPSPHES
jgi:hypothetical protein